MNLVFIACNERLATFQQALEDERMKSYNELLQLGFTEKMLKERLFRGIDLKGIDRDKKMFLIELPEELTNSSLLIEEDFYHSFARFLTDKKYIYRVTGIEESIFHFFAYIAKYANTWRELEIWRVHEDDYVTEVPIQVINYRNFTLIQLERFFEEKNPKQLLLIKK